MRTVLSVMLVVAVLGSIANSAPISEADLKNLPAGIRQNRSTQADFQEQRVIRLMKKPILSSGRIWFQPPNRFRREVKGNSPSVTVSDGRQLCSIKMGSEPSIDTPNLAAVVKPI